jgi:eukaryotic-like serine/threonine-protein kinase
MQPSSESLARSDAVPSRWGTMLGPAAFGIPEGPPADLTSAGEGPGMRPVVPPRTRMDSIRPAPMIPVGFSVALSQPGARRGAGTQVGLGIPTVDEVPLSAPEVEAILKAPKVADALASDASYEADEQGDAEALSRLYEQDPRLDSSVTLEPPPRPSADDDATDSSRGDGARLVLGRYEILSRIARGGMGTVYLCRARGEGGFRRLFALKVLRGHLARDPQAARMFLEEARLAARIYHPHVVGIIDVGSHGRQPFIVMDYVEGGSLHELLERHPAHRPPSLIVSLVLDALSGLHAVHTLEDDEGAPLGLVHCDVSPPNLLVGLDGSCRLSDFGVAKVLAARSPGAVRHGKPAYIAPEHLRGGPVDARTDVFSMGVILWTALTGERLFEGATVDETLQNVLDMVISPPSTRGLGPPACLDRVCMKALARNPNARYSGAQEMLEELRAVAIAEGLLASPTEVADWVRQTLGMDVQERRMQVLGSSRRSRTSGAAFRSLPEEDQTSDMPPGALHPSTGAPSSRLGSELATGSPPLHEATLPETIVLPPRRDPRKVVMLAALACVFTTVLLLFFPDWFASAFRVPSDAPPARALNEKLPAGASESSLSSPSVPVPTGVAPELGYRQVENAGDRAAGRKNDISR